MFEVAEFKKDVVVFLSDRIKDSLNTVYEKTRKRFEDYEIYQIERFNDGFKKIEINRFKIIKDSVCKDPGENISLTQVESLLKNEVSSFLRRFSLGNSFFEELRILKEALSNSCVNEDSLSWFEDTAIRLKMVSRCFLCQSGHFVKNDVDFEWQFSGCMISQQITVPVEYKCTALESKIDEY